MSKPLTLRNLRRLGLQFPRGTRFSVFVAPDMKEKLEAMEIIPNTVLVSQYANIKPLQSGEIGRCEMYRFVLEPSYDAGHWFAGPDQELSVA